MTPVKPQSDSSHTVSWLAAIGAYSFWALMPLFWRLFEGTPAFIIFIHRSLWAFPFLIGISFLPMFRRQPLFDFDRQRLPWLALSGIMIGANWWIYIYGVAAQRVIEIRLGYFLSPLLSAALGVVFLKERLTRWQWLGVSLVCAGVVCYGIHIWTVPTMAIGLALTFSAYSLIRKVVSVAPMTALTTETFILFLLAIAYLIFARQDPDFLMAWDNHAWLLALAGTMTAIPLLWFAVAVRGLTMTTMGMLNYISPTGKFLIAILLFGEPISAVDFLFFMLIWVGVGIYLHATYRLSKKASAH